MAVEVEFRQYCNFNGVVGFQFGNGEPFCVESIDDSGVMVIEPIYATTIHAFSNTVANCLKSHAVANGVRFSGLTTIEFFYLGVRAIVTKETAYPDTITRIWGEQMECKFKRHGRQFKAEAYRKKAQKLVKQAISEQEMWFKCDKAHDIWESFVDENSSDENGIRTVRYAEDWAKYMQYLMLLYPQQFVSQLALRASNDVNIDGISGEMYGCATNALFAVWKYGSLLRSWHKDEYGQRGYGTVPPNMLIRSAR